MTQSSHNIDATDFADTDLCVLCGMCTPHCPTYSLYQVEAESPRGRISLIQALARQQLQADDKTLDHLNHCLGCRACESVCPSKVPFMALMDKARQLTAKQYSQHPAISKLLNTLERPGGLGNQQSTLNFVKKSGLHQLLQRLPGMPGLSRSATILNHSNIQLFNDLYPAQDAQGSVILFTGCMGSTFNTEAIDSSIRLLTYFGFNVHIPGNQHCCGGLHQHSGHINTAQELAEKNMSLFQSCDAETLIYIDSGCGSQLQQPPVHPSISHIGQFLLKLIPPASDYFAPSPQTVWLHESCSLKNTLQLGGLNQRLLNLIPDLSTQNLPDHNSCCGAGGSHFIQYPEQADRLLDKKLTGLESSTPQFIVSDNIGCSLHFKTGLSRRKIPVEVIHPLTMLARHLK